MFPNESKYDNMKYPYLKYMMQRKTVHMQYLPTLENLIGGQNS
jgi:hypothetical protein